MVLLALNRYFSQKLTISYSSRRHVLAGSILFIISDTILAFNKFYKPIP